MTKSCAAVAVKVHANMCNDNGFGYSWEERWGHSGDKVKYTVNGETFTINRGDYDCSSSTITAWKTAISKTKYAGKLDGATYTGNMRSVFVNSGLFEWKPMSFLAKPGDLYLNEANHVAMCQTQTPDVLSEFSWGDNGAYGNRRGDQSGNEASVHGYYDYPWDGILHYNGKADSSTTTTTKPTTTTTTTTTTPNPVYAVRPVKGDWLSNMKGLKDTGGSKDTYAGIFKKAIGYIAVKNVGKYQVYTKKNKWLDYVNKFDKNDLENGCAGDGTAILGFRIINNKYKYRVHFTTGAWTAWKKGDKNTFVGDLKTPIDAIQIQKA